MQLNRFCIVIFNGMKICPGSTGLFERFETLQTLTTAVLRYLGGFKGVVRCEGDVQEEYASLVHRAWWSQDG